MPFSVLFHRSTSIVAIITLITAALLLLNHPSHGMALTKSEANSLYWKTFKGPSPIWYDDSMIQHSNYIIKSYWEVCRKNIFSVEIKNAQDDPVAFGQTDAVAAAKKLFFLPDTIVLSHGLQDGPEGPIMNYGNAAALKRWAASWEQLTTLPSRQIAEPGLQEAREQFMQKVAKDNFVDNYEGVRRGLDGSRFRILNTCVWNIIIDGTLLGQAACIHSCEDLL